MESVFLPGPEEVAMLASDGPELEGTIVGFSDSGNRPAAYAVIEVVRRLSVVVPVERLTAAPPDASRMQHEQ